MLFFQKINKKVHISENSRIVLVNVVGAYLVRGGALFVGLINTPSYLRYFNNESVLGIWFTLLSILSWVLNFDMGIGHGLRNKIAVTIARNDNYTTKKYISSAYIFISAMSAVITIILLISGTFVNWNSFLNISESDMDASTLRTAVLIVILSIMLQFILRLITSILYALQKSFIPNLITLITNIIMLVFVLICNKTGNNNNIIKLAVVYLIAANLPLVFTTLVIFFTKLKDARPSYKYYERRYALDTLKTGGMFFLIQIFKLLIISTNLILITKLLSSKAVVEFNIYYKLFSLISTLFTLGVTPVWSAVTRASAQNNYKWIKKVILILYGFGMVVIIGQLLMLPFMQFIMDIWLDTESIKVNYFIMLFFILDSGIAIWSGINASVCNGLNELKLQIFTMGIGAITKIPLSILCVHFLGSYAGVILAHSVCLIPYCIVQTIWLYKHIDHKIPKKSEIEVLC